MSTYHVPAIDADCNDNEAGIMTIDVINDEDLTFPLPAVDAAPADWTISSDVVLIDAAIAGFERFKFVRFQAEYSETPNDADNYDSSLKFMITKDDATKRNTFRNMFNPCSSYTVIITDANGHVKLQPNMRFRDTFTSGLGGSNSDRNKYDAEFYKSGKKAYTYTGQILRKT